MKKLIATSVLLVVIGLIIIAFEYYLLDLAGRSLK